MSVIAYRNLTIVGDTLGNDEGTVIGHVHKVGKTKDGWLWGACGYASAMAPFAAWAETREGDPPAFDGHHSDHILVSPQGEVKWWTGTGWVVPLPQDFHAWGCGRELAMGAMANGGDAYRAVEIACQYDIYCGGSVYGVSMIPDGDIDPIIDRIIEDAPPSPEAWPEVDILNGTPIEPVDNIARPTGWSQKMGLK